MKKRKPGAKNITRQQAEILLQTYLNKQNGKTGRPKMIESPEILLMLFNEYKAQTKSNPIKKMDFVGKDGKKVYRELERPLTIEGLYAFVFKKIGLYSLRDYFSNSNNAYTAFSQVVTHIKTEIFQDQVEGGMAGIYNHNLTARINGLADKKEKTEDRQITVRLLREAEQKQIEDQKILSLPVGSILRDTTNDDIK